MFEVSVALFDRNSDRGIIFKDPLDCWSIANLLVKLDPISLLDAFGHLCVITKIQ